MESKARFTVQPVHPFESAREVRNRFARIALKPPKLCNSELCLYLWIIMAFSCDECLVTTSCLILTMMATSAVRSFEVLRKLGAGNFGSVFEVQDTDAEAVETLACKQIATTQQGITDFEQVRLTSLREHPDRTGSADLPSCECAGSIDIESAG